MHKITKNSISNKRSTPSSTNLVGVHPRNIYSKFEANPCFGLREVKYWILHSDIYKYTVDIHVT